MNLRRLTATFSPWAWLLIALAAMTVAVVVWLIVTGPSRARQEAASARVGQVTAEGRAKAAGDAVDVLDKTHTADAAQDQQMKDDQDALRKAPGYGQTLDRELNRAGRLGLCNDPAYRRDPQCVQRTDR